MSEKIRVRFAPSPTGMLHVGNARTAVMNWLCARHYGGDFILRIEDTDTERSTAESEKSIMEQLQWLGLDWDEGPVKGGKYGPYRQSERLKLYNENADTLLAENKAYYCFCTKEELQEQKERAIREKTTPGYNGKCRNLTEEEKDKLRGQGNAAAVRFRVPEEIIVLNDLVQGEIRFESAVISDFVIQREDGSATYNFAVVVDDLSMNITHVIRGNDHVSNTPKQILLYKALRGKIPKFAHIPMITGEDGARLSKRHGHTSVAEFKDAGYMPEALINFMSLLSWSSESGDEILSVDRLIKEFDFSRISRSPAVFDRTKLNWLNGKYIRSLDDKELVDGAKPFLEKADMIENDSKRLERIISSVKDNVETFSDFPKYASIFFVDKIDISGEKERELIKSASSQKVYAKLLNQLSDLLNGKNPLTDKKILTIDIFQAIMKKIQEETGIKGKDLWMPVRVAMTGQMHGPELPKILEILGVDRCKLLINAVTVKEK